MPAAAHVRERRRGADLFRLGGGSPIGRADGVTEHWAQVEEFYLRSRSKTGDYHPHNVRAACRNAGCAMVRMRLRRGARTYALAKAMIAARDAAPARRIATGTGYAPL